MKLGSLFDGSGGFPFAGALNGITPVWASEIEPYPIAVTKSRFPNMEHIGNVAAVHGYAIEPVDVITFGSPCQDMSVAGKRAGMKHDEKGDEETTRSGLFYEAIRIIREMREKTHGRYPTFAVWENVPGAFSSQHGEDFLCVLKELAKIVAEEGTLIPRPSIGKWLNAGEIVGNGFSIAWRVLDAQYWGVPQRRKRIYLVADFADERAGEILFERDSMQRNSAQSGAERKATAEDAHGCADGGGDVGCMNPWDPQSERIYDPDGGHPCLRANASGGQDRSGIVYALQGNGIDRADTAGCNGCGWRENECYTLNTIDRHSVVYKEVLFEPKSAFDENWTARDTKNALRAESSKSNHALCIDCRNHTAGDVSGTIQAKENGGQSLNFINPVCYSIDALSSNSMKSANPHSGFHAADHAKCLDTSDQNPAKNQGGNVIVQKSEYKGSDAQYADAGKTMCYDARGNDYGRTCPTITGDHENRVTDYTALCIGNGQLAQITMAQVSNTLDCMHDKQAIITKGNPLRKYIVRRLTPLECSRLQGFPDGWATPLRIDRMTPRDAWFWESVRKTYADAMGKKYAPCKDTNSLTKWYNGLHTDSAEYKMWGNGIALPCAAFVLRRIAEVGRMREEQISDE